MPLGSNLGPIASHKFLPKCLKYGRLNINIAHLNCLLIGVRYSRWAWWPSWGQYFWYFCHKWNLAKGLCFCHCRFARVPRDRLVFWGGNVALYISSKLHFGAVFRIRKEGIYESPFVELSLRNYKLLVSVACIVTHSDLLAMYSNIVIPGDFNCYLFHPDKAFNAQVMYSRKGLCYRHNCLPTPFTIQSNPFRLSITFS